MGYITSCTKLKGHTGCGKDMLDANYKDWISYIHVGGNYDIEEIFDGEKNGRMV